MKKCTIVCRVQNRSRNQKKVHQEKVTQKKVRQWLSKSQKVHFQLTISS